ncbi:MAG: Hsp20/alpha crystallin family protein [Sphaerochaetaceae bacterium]
MKYIMNSNQNYPMVNDFESMFNDMMTGFGLGPSSVPAVDIQENDKDYVIEAELPGYKENEVEVNVEKHVLRLSSVKQSQKEEKDAKKYLMRERCYQSFSRSFSLPEDVDESAIEGKFANGVLTVTLPKKELAQPKRITIKIGSDQNN